MVNLARIACPLGVPSGTPLCTVDPLPAGDREGLVTTLMQKLLYAQVVKSYRRRRIVGVKHRVVFGRREAIESNPGQAGLEDQLCVASRELAFPPASTRCIP